MLSAATLPPAPPALPPAPPSCIGVQSEGERCRIGLRLAPCVAGVCLEFDKPWFAAFLNIRCEAHSALQHSLDRCLHPSVDMLKYATVYEYTGVGVVLSTEQQEQRANPSMPFSNAPATDALHYFATALNTTVRLQRPYTYVWKSSVDLYWINTTYDDGGARLQTRRCISNTDALSHRRRPQRMSRPHARWSLQTALLARR